MWKLLNNICRGLAWIGILASLFGVGFMTYHILNGVNYIVVLAQILPPTFCLAVFSIWVLITEKKKPEPVEELKPEPTWFQNYINSPYK